MAYPTLSGGHLVEEDLLRHFTLDSGDRNLLGETRTEQAQLELAILLKTYRFLGYFPRRRAAVPTSLVERIAQQLAVEPNLFHQGGKRLWEQHHIRLLRSRFGLRPWSETEDVSALTSRLLEQLKEEPSRAVLLDTAVAWCRERNVEIPRKKELKRLVGSARHRFFEELDRKVASRLSTETRERMDLSLKTGSRLSQYGWLKTPPGPAGIKTLKIEVLKLSQLREFGIQLTEHLAGVSEKVLRELVRRARREDASRMRHHRAERRYTLMAALLYARSLELTDQITQLFIDLIRRIGNKTKQALEREMVANLPKVVGKNGLLDRVVLAGSSKPKAGIWGVLVEVIGEEKLHLLVKEARETDTSYPVIRTRKMKTKYSQHYRQMLKPVLETLTFRTNNPKHRPLLKALELVRCYIDSKVTWYPDTESIPTELLTGAWAETVIEDGPHGPRAVRHLFELCVLHKLEPALKCKEVWVEGAYRFRNPDEDLPSDWEGTARIERYERLGIPLSPDEFVASVQARMLTALEAADDYFGQERKGGVTIRRPGGGERGFFFVPKLQKRPERPLLKEIKGQVKRRWGIHDLLDVLLEADRLVGFSSFFRTSGQRQLLSQEEIQRRLLLVLYGLGTNLGLARIHSAAKPDCSYDDLRYFRSHYLTIETLRMAIAAVVNRTLELRNPDLWGQGTSCMSDGKQLDAWDQNLVTEWNPHYRKRGVMAYWHVETNALAIYSQLQAHRASEVAAMLRGLAQHDTDMRVERNFVDSHGQSEVAFSFSEFMGVSLMPRLKGIREERLYLPNLGMAGRFPRLAGVTARPIRWKHVLEQYDEMVRHVVAVLEGTGPVDSILRRFYSANPTHPTYKGFIELGKALKTCFLCEYLTRAELRREVHQALNVVENWNSCVDFVFFGRRSEISSNNPEMQELAVLSLHLLMSSLVLVNTVMVERVLSGSSGDKLLERMEEADLKALTPLFTSNVNPYGDFSLDLNKPSILEVAA